MTKEAYISCSKVLRIGLLRNENVSLVGLQLVVLNTHLHLTTLERLDRNNGPLAWSPLDVVVTSH